MISTHKMKGGSVCVLLRATFSHPRLDQLPDLFTLGKSSLQTRVMLFHELPSLYGKTEQCEPDALQDIPLEHGSQAGFAVGLQAVR